MPKIELYIEKLFNEKSGRFDPAVIEITDGKFSKIEWGKPAGTQAKKKRLEILKHSVGPSLVDLHVHTRDFGERHKETFESLEASALKGGVSLMAAMANTVPRLDCADHLDDFFRKTKKLAIDLIPFAAVTKNLEGKEATDWKALLKLPIAGLSDDGKPLLDPKMMEKALLAVKASKKMLSLHEEDTRFSKASQLHLSETSMRLGIEGSPSAAEFLMVERDLKIAEKNSAPLHFCHLSTRESAALLHKAKKKGLAVSSELTPHHGLLTILNAEQLPPEDLAYFKVCPPIREEEDRQALLRGLKGGAIDVLASDHAPHSCREKEVPYEMAMHGIISMENAFTLWNTVRREAALPWSRFFEVASSSAAKLLKRPVGRIAVGYEASFLVFDPDALETLDWSQSRSQNHPYRDAKKKFYGRVIAHWIRGEKIYGSR